MVIGVGNRSVSTNEFCRRLDLSELGEPFYQADNYVVFWMLRGDFPEETFYIGNNGVYSFPKDAGQSANT